jgi:hypothetical protein
MLSLNIAHLHEQGEDLIIAPLDGTFGNKTSMQKNAAIAAIQRAAIRAGLKGEVVVAWEDNSGRMRFIGPRPWHPFLQEIDMRWIEANINRQLFW